MDRLVSLRAIAIQTAADPEVRLPIPAGCRPHDVRFENESPSRHKSSDRYTCLDAGLHPAALARPRYLSGYAPPRPAQKLCATGGLERPGCPQKAPKWTSLAMLRNIFNGGTLMS